jgi:hypothetical protein
MAAVGRKQFNWPAIVGFWAVLAIVLIIRANLQADTVPLYADTDDAMRMVTVTDLLHGQAWQDNIEDRDNAPYGALMHWSRLVDAPIAGLIRILSPFLGSHSAEWASMLWPLLLLLPLLIGSVALTTRFVGEEGALAGLVLPVLALPVLNEFLPGRVDHHSVQILLTLGLTLATLGGRRSLPVAVLAGLCAATSIAIGIETIATVVVAIVAFALFWVADPVAARRPLLGFAASFAGFTLLHFLAATPPSLYFAVFCDSLSFTYVVVALLVGLALASAVLIGGRLKLWWQRLLVMGVLGVLAAAASLWFSPVCIGGPYAQVDPVLTKDYFPFIKEAQNLLVRFADDPALTFSYAATSFFGLGIVIWRCLKTKGDERTDWLVLLGYLAAGVIVMCIQIRGARFAALLAVPAGAWLIVQVRGRYLTTANLRRAAGLVGAWILFASVAQFAVGSSAAAVLGSAEYRGAPVRVVSDPAAAPGSSPRAICFNRRVFDKLAALPPSRLMTSMDMAPPILYYTPHSVTSAGYHRNQQGSMDVIRFFNADESVARGIAAARGLQYLVVCKELPEIHGFAHAAPSSFAMTSSAGHPWSWLKPISNPQDVLQIYRIELPQ